MTRIAITISMLVAVGCAGPREQPPQSVDGATRTRATATPRSAAPTTEPAAAPPAAPAVALAPTALGRLMTGAWDISPTGVFGPHLTVTVDSARGPVFFGRISRVVAGDVLLDVDRFERFVGVIGPDSVARVRVNWKDKGPPPAEIVGKISAGEWRLSRFVWGGEQQVIQNRTWTGRKAK